MHSRSLIFPACLLLATSAGAQTQHDPLTDPESTSQVQVRAPAQPFQFWEYEAEGVRFEKRVLMPHLQNTTYITYRLLSNEPMRLELSPFIA